MIYELCRAPKRYLAQSDAYNKIFCHPPLGALRNILFSCAGILNVAFLFCVSILINRLPIITTYIPKKE